MVTLRTLLFPKGVPSIAEGTLAVYWTLSEVIATRAGGGVGGGPDLAVLEKDGADRWRIKVLTKEDLEHLDAMYDSLRASIEREFRQAATGRVEPPLPAVGPAKEAPPPAAAPAPKASAGGNGDG